MEFPQEDSKSGGLEVLRSAVLAILVVLVVVVLFMALSQPFGNIFSNIVRGI